MISNSVGFVAHNAHSASLFASCAKKISKQGISVQVFASPKAVKPFQEKNIPTFPLEEQIAKTCSVVVIDHTYNQDVQRSLDSKVLLLVYPDMTIPEGCPEVAKTVVAVAKKVIAKRPPVVESSQEKTRVSNYETVSKYLESLKDEELVELIEKKEVMYSGTGGPVRKLDIEGVQVFVKQVPLNTKEVKTRTTENQFNLPTYYQYGVGSEGFSAWRELETHIMTSEWVMAGETSHFPILYHWRALPQKTDQKGGDSVEWEKEVSERSTYWGRSPGIEERMRANHDAPAYLTLFLECFPQNLHSWLKEQDDGAFEMIDQNIQETLAIMNAKGMLHFDAHFLNVLTDGKQIYFSDFGLTTSSQFSLSSEEREFFEKHQNYDRCYLAQELTNHILERYFDEITGDKVLEAFSQGITSKEASVLPANLFSIVQRYAAITLRMNQFMQTLRKDETKQEPFPAEELSTLLLKIKLL